MGRRRRKVIRLPKKTLPKVFICPRCGRESIRIERIKGEGKAIVQCGSCHLMGEVEIKPIYEDVDIYCTFTDLYHAGKLAESVEIEREG